MGWPLPVTDDSSTSGSPQSVRSPLGKQYASLMRWQFEGWRTSTPHIRPCRPGPASRRHTARFCLRTRRSRRDQAQCANRCLNVRLWLGADIQRESAELPLMTHSGHSVEYAVQQVGPNTRDTVPGWCAALPMALPLWVRSGRLSFHKLSEHQASSVHLPALPCGPPGSVLSSLDVR